MDRGQKTILRTLYSLGDTWTKIATIVQLLSLAYEYVYARLGAQVCTQRKSFVKSVYFRWVAANQGT